MKTEIVKLTQIKVNGANPRTISKEKFDKLINSVLVLPKMLDIRHIVVDDTMTVLGGNMRYRALVAISEMTEEDIITRLDATRDYKKKTDAERGLLIAWWREWLKAPFVEIIRAINLSADEQREFIIKDNASFGSWDMDVLANEWDSQDLDDWGLDVWQEDNDKSEEVKEDEALNIENMKETRVKKGDIWLLGEHRLMCGDSTSKEDVSLLMGGEKADMCFTDPPYGVSYAEKNTFLNAAGTGHRLTRSIENDDKEPTEMYDIWRSAFLNIYEATKEKMSYYITAPQGGDLLLLLLQAVRDSGFSLKHQLIWNKNNHVLGRCDYNYKHEPIIYGWKIKGTHHFYGKSGFTTSVWDIPKPNKSELHPTMKPITLVAACIKDASKEGDSVIDLFGGSGTTLITAEQLGRKCYTMELDPFYCEVIIARWEELTGKKAKKEE